MDNDLDEMLDTFMYSGLDGTSYGTDDAKDDKAELKQSILAKYTPNDEVERLVREQFGLLMKEWQKLPDDSDFIMLLHDLMKGKRQLEPKDSKGDIK